MKLVSIVGGTLCWLAGLNAVAQTRKPAQLLPASPALAQSPFVAGKTLARNDYMGDAACGSCHKEKTDSFHQTAHYLTSKPPDENSILGKFTPGSDTLTTSNPELYFRMDQKEEGFFQTAVQGTSPYTTERSERFGLVIGSGGKGQTYLFWKGDQLFQLPVSYWRELGWVNSPGYRDGIANFGRPIIPRCLECHGTYFEVTAAPNHYSRNGMVLGIICEKCHGSGHEHLRKEQAQPGTRGKSEILNPASFPRQRQMDLCAWCHAGHGTGTAPTFSYVPGNVLSDYIELPPPDPRAELDVHGSQVELLQRSRCFQTSEMTCLTCHDVHTTQHDPQIFSQRCLACHNAKTTFPKEGHPKGNNCIDCHMPKQQTKLIVFKLKGKSAQPEVRTHWIKIYRSDVSQ
jgi:hypothetical protein